MSYTAEEEKRINRAKLFAPFAALKGFENEIAKRERIIVEKIEISEERLAELDRIFKSVQLRDMVCVIYYENKQYIKLSGMVSKIDINGRYIRIVNKKIPFDNIYDLELI